MRTIDVLWFAVLRELRGTARERIATAAATPEALWTELRARHGFALPAARLRVAVNGEFAAWTVSLKDGDEVAFVPPTAGG